MSKFMIKDVRLAFPSLFHKAVFEGKETKFEATLLLDKEKHKDVIAKIKADINQLIKTELDGKKLKPGKTCFQDGDDTDYDGYAGCMSFKAANSKRPPVYDRDKSPLVEEDDKPYAGCYVNAIVDYWVQNNQYGARVNANLLGIQFVRDGDAFGAGGSVASDDDFDDISDADDSW